MVDRLQTENKSLKEQLEAAETNEELYAKLTAANRALSEQHRLNSELVKEIIPLRDKIAEIRKIAGG